MDYNFVEKLPEEYTCQICMKVLNEPQLTDCCGQHFCKGCLETWFEKQRKKTCPHCRSESFNFMRSLPLKRKIDDLKVYCSKKQQGCTIAVKLCELEAHLSKKTMNGCGFVEVSCTNPGCGVSVIRKDLDKHVRQVCPKRLVICQHCGLGSAHDIITGEHAGECEEAPLNCPRGCKEGVGIKRKDLDKHKEVCKLEPIRCPFFNAGCKEPLIRQDLNLHLEQNTNQHLLKVMTAHDLLLTAHNTLVTAHDSLVTKHDSLVTAHDSLVQRMDTASSQITGLQRVVRSIRLHLHKHDLDLVKDGDSLTFMVPGLHVGWKSDPFYVVDYKMCVSYDTFFFRSFLELVLMEGEHDDQLEWPMNLELDIWVKASCGGHSARVDEKVVSCIQCNLNTVRQRGEIMRMTVNNYASDIKVDVEVSAHVHCK